MHAAFSIWKDRIAPVFDVASQAVIISRTAEPNEKPTMVSMQTDRPATIIASLLKCNVESLVCGAISRPLHNSIVAQGITIHPFVMGTLRELTQAWRDNQLKDNRFLMPGYDHAINAPRNGMRRQRHRLGQKQGAEGSCRQSGEGNSTAPYGSQTLVARKTICRCPLCEHQAVHVPGIPCSTKTCPYCHTPLCGHNI